nr:MAG TPA: restriction alleviation protein [Caudoviricetes sp.]
MISAYNAFLTFKGVYMDKIIFLDGSEYPCVFCGLATVGLLYVTLTGLSFVEAAAIFGDENKTAKIRYVAANGEETIFEHYTKFEYLVNETDGQRAALRQKYASEV